VVDPVTNGRAVFLDGDDTDGSANSTRTNGLPFDNWLNKGTLGGTFSNATALQQPLFATALVGGKSGATFDGIDDRLTSSLAASAFTFMHDGSGMSIYAVSRSSTSAVMTIASTRGSAASSRGLMLGTNTTFRASVQMSDGVALQAAITGANNSLSTSLFDVYSARLSSSRVPNMRSNVNGASVGTTAATAFSGGAPAASLVVGANASGASFFNGNLVCMLVYNVDHDDTQEAAIRAFLAAKYGVTFPA
jgi:hypothetical protein